MVVKSIPAIVESTFETAFAAVRAKHSALRELDAQVERTEKRAVDARRIADTCLSSRQAMRIELGLELLRARPAWPERGPKAKGWGDFLKAEGIDDSTAARYMDLAKGSPAGDFTQPDRLSEIPHPAEGAGASPDGPAPSPRAPLGLLADMQLMLGRWEDVLSQDEIGMVDALITDPPYSEKTHTGARSTRNDGSDPDGMGPNYPPWAELDVQAFVESWSPRVRGWMVCLCDDTMIPWYRAAYERMGRFAFAPVPCVIRGMSVRARGDGPSSWAVYAMVARPRTQEFVNWGTLDGAYVGDTDHGSKHGRGKPRWLTDLIVRHYTRGNDLVCDPLAGYGGTLVSALLQRRRAIGAEMDEAAVTEAFARANALNEEPVTNTAEETAA